MSSRANRRGGANDPADRLIRFHRHARPPAEMTDTLILCYHAVSTSWPALLSVDPEQFERQLEHLLARGYRATTFGEALSGAGAGRTVAITFDDAYRSVFDLGLPILARLGMPATVFVPTAKVGGDGPMAWPGIDEWLQTPHRDELVGCTWDQIGELAQRVGRWGLTPACIRTCPSSMTRHWPRSWGIRGRSSSAASTSRVARSHTRTARSTPGWGGGGALRVPDRSGAQRASGWAITVSGDAPGDGPQGGEPGGLSAAYHAAVPAARALPAMGPDDACGSARKGGPAAPARERLSRRSTRPGLERLARELVKPLGLRAKLLPQ